MIKLNNSSSGSLSAFQWSASEQVWPFEKTSAGQTLYCKEIDCGYAPNAGAKYIAYNIPGCNPGDDMFRVEGRRKVDSTYYLPMPGNATVADYNITFGVSGANLFLFTSIDYSSNQVVLRMVYKKNT